MTRIANKQSKQANRSSNNKKDIQQKDLEQQLQKEHKKDEKRTGKEINQSMIFLKARACGTSDQPFVVASYQNKGQKALGNESERSQRTCCERGQGKLLRNV